MGVGLTFQELEIFCSRYVFAPICRGVTSKRSTVPAISALSDQYSSSVVKSILEQIKKKYESDIQERDPDYSW